MGSLSKIAIPDIVDQRDRVRAEIRFVCSDRCRKCRHFELKHFVPHFQWLNIGKEIVDEIRVEVWIVGIFYLASVCKALHKHPEVTQVKLEILNIRLATFYHCQTLASRFESGLESILSFERVFQ